MSIANITDQIDYPESDGKPMGETDLHRDWMIRILEIFRYRYRGERVYTASDLLLYYEEGQPTKFVVPDNFVVLDCEPGRRRIFKTWNEGKVPDVIFEVTSRGTSSVDIIDKPVLYERIGVKEYFLYDPTSSYLTPALQGYRLTNGVYVEIPKRSGRLTCETLGIDLRLQGDNLVMIDSASGETLLPAAEAEALLKDRERRLKEEERSLKEQERSLKEQERKLKEEERRLKIEQQAMVEEECSAKEREYQLRLAVEAENRRLVAEIERLKRGDSSGS